MFNVFKYVTICLLEICFGTRKLIEGGIAFPPRIIKLFFYAFCQTFFELYILNILSKFTINFCTVFIFLLDGSTLLVPSLLQKPTENISLFSDTRCQLIKSRNSPASLLMGSATCLLLHI